MTQQDTPETPATTPEAASLGRFLARLRGAVVLQRIAAGAGWTSAGYLAVQSLRLGSRLYLTHLLAPDAFGVFAIVGAVVIGGQMLTDVGILPSVVQNPRGDQTPFLRTAYTIQLLRGAVVAAIVALLGAPLAAAYDLPDLRILLPVAALGIVLNDLRNPALWVLARKMRLGRLTLLEIAAEVFGVAAAIGIALASPTVWALIVPNIVVALAMAAGSQLVADRRIAPGWERESARALLGFGGLIFLSTATWFLASEGERLYLPTVLTLDEVGVLSVALFLANFVGRAFGQVFIRVLFPLFAERLRGGGDHAERYYLHLRSALAGATILMLAGFLVSPWILVRVLGDEYAPAAAFVPILGVRVAFEVSQSLGSTLLLADGRVMVQVVANIVRIAAVLIAVPIGAAMAGPVGVVWALAAAAAPSALVYTFGIARSFPRLARVDFAYLAFLALAAIGMVAAVWLLH